VQGTLEIGDVLLHPLSQRLFIEPIFLSYAGRPRIDLIGQRLHSVNAFTRRSPSNPV
jgi:hypothetical protein